MKNIALKLDKNTYHSDAVEVFPQLQLSIDFNSEADALDFMSKLNALIIDELDRYVREIVNANQNTHEN